MKVSKRFLLVLFSFMFFTTVALVLRLVAHKDQQPVGRPSSEASLEPSLRPIHTFEDVLLELSLSEGYYNKNKIPLPENYETITNEYEKIARLLNKVFEREVTFKYHNFLTA